MTQVYFSPAKINLSLLVFPLNKNGYHNIFSVFQKISLADHISFSFVNSNSARLSITGEGIDFPTDSTNILFKVFDLFKKNIHVDIKVHIKKSIPLGSGMGGSSSNAATFIRFLLEQDLVSIQTVDSTDISKQIGADVPFFLNQTTALVEGIGDKVTSLKTKSHFYIIINPNIHCDTRVVYSNFDHLPSEIPTLELQESIRQKYIGPNMLLNASLTAYPKLNHIYEQLKNKLQQTVYMTGSGATFFIPFESKSIANECFKLVQKHFPDFYVVLTETFQE